MNRNSFSKWRWMPATALLLGALSIALLIWTDGISEKQRVNYMRVGAAMDIRIHTATFHLWLEETLGGDQKIELAEIWKDLESAANLVNAILKGGETEHGLIAEPLEKEEPRILAEGIRASLTELENIALERLQNPKIAVSGSDFDRRFDEVFQKIVDNASRLEAIFEAERAANQLKSRRLFAGILSVWSLIVILATIVHFGREGRRIAAERALLTANEQLRSQTEELRRHRENLEELVGRRTLELRSANDSLQLEILQRKQKEEQLRKSEDFVREVLETVDEGFIVIDPEYRIISANRAYLFLVGKTRESVIGSRCYEISHNLHQACYETGEDCPARKTFSTGRPHEASHIHYDGRGNPVFVETKSFPLKDDFGRTTSIIEVISDVTDKKRLEEQLLHSQKMEAVGQLAGGVAHDFNNILTAITGYGHLLAMKLSDRDPLKAFVEPILSSAERAASLTQSLLAFSRKQIINPKPSSIEGIIRNVEKLLLRLIGEDIKLETRLPDRDLTAMADTGQIGQVLMNLATNARDAMPEGGALTIALNLEELDHEFTKTHGFGKSGRYALISVSDTGAGMDKRTTERIFEPFFTTKETGKGTCLGLSIVYGIIKQHNGYITVYSEPGKGTTFRIYLPLLEAGFEEAAAFETSIPGRGKETALLAEDDPEVRKATKAVLEEFGYSVIEAVDGEDALEKFRENSEKIHFFILDVIMPGKNGKEVCKDIRRTAPGAKVLFLSGYTADVIHKKGILDESLDFLSKPVSPNVLLKKVREILER